MKTRYHLEITRRAFAPCFSEQALQTILDANIGQDRLRYQLGHHDRFHFDSNAFEAGFAYIAKQHDLVLESVRDGNYEAARQALGRLTHAWQDFYSHSNYVRLWREQSPSQPSSMINPLEPALLNSPRLISGNSQVFLELLAMIPVVKRLVKPLMPPNSHARLNLDSPESGSDFDAAFTAALKQTQNCFDELQRQLKRTGISLNQIAAFRGQPISEVQV